MSSITFEAKGLLVGVIAYPFDNDGDEFFKHEFEENLFGKYKNKVAESFGSHLEEKYKDTSICTPKGYSLFGTYNLAVLSLIDGYALGNRVFHMGHGNRDSEKYVDYRYQVLTGVGCPVCEGGDYLEQKAKDTFLRSENRYPYIGITRLKLNDNLLLGTGVELLQAVRLKTEELLKDKESEHTDAFTIDTFGNSEIVLLSFSDSLSKLHDLVNLVKSLKAEDLPEGSFHVENSLLAELVQPVDSTSNDMGAFHVFTGTYTHLGYDMQWRQDGFLPVAKEAINLKMQFRWVLKPGHEKALGKIKEEYSKYWKKICRKRGHTKEDRQKLRGWWERQNWTGKIDTVRNHLTGVNVHYTRTEFNLTDYCDLLNIFKNRQDEDKQIPENLDIRKHMRSLRTQLFFQTRLKKEEMHTHNDVKLDLEKFKFSVSEMNDFRHQLHSCGISKLTRERVMKMFARFNEYIGIRQIYFIELKEFLCNVMQTIDQFARDEEIDIDEMDEYLMHVVQAFEGAFFNRYHQSVDVGAQNDITLEYNGGIQQYVSSFTLSFQEALKLLSNVPDSGLKSRMEGALLYVSGYESVKSQREIMRINMNLITYPELFAVSIYKEAGNFIAERTWRREDKGSEAGLRASVMWHDNLTRKKIPENLRSLVRKSDIYRSECPAHYLLAESLNTELTEYFVADIHNLYFGFNGDVELLYYFYWKYFLQLSASYKRTGEMKTDAFVSSLLRLFVILFYSCKDDPDRKKSILESWKKKAFDPRLSSLWVAHFPRVLEMAEVIWEGLKQERYLEFIQYELFNKIYMIAGEGYPSYNRLLQVASSNGQGGQAAAVWAEKFRSLIDYEKQMGKTPDMDDVRQTDDLFRFWSAVREYRIAKLVKKMEQYELLEKGKEEVFPELFLSDMLIAYLKVIRTLDDKGVLKSLLRDENGTPFYGARKNIQNETGTENEDFNSSFSPLLSDPQGGMFTHGLQERLSYFAYRTVLYKSLWNYSMRRKKEDVLNVIHHA